MGGWSSTSVLQEFPSGNISWLRFLVKHNQISSVCVPESFGIAFPPSRAAESAFPKGLFGGIAEIFKSVISGRAAGSDSSWKRSSFGLKTPKIWRVGRNSGAVPALPGAGVGSRVEKNGILWKTRDPRNPSTLQIPSRMGKKIKNNQSSKWKEARRRNVKVPASGDE